MEEDLGSSYMTIIFKEKTINWNFPSCLDSSCVYFKQVLNEDESSTVQFILWFIVQLPFPTRGFLGELLEDLISYLILTSVQFSSVAQSCLTLCDPMDYSTEGFPVHHQILEFAQTHVHRVGDAIQPSNPLSSPSPPAFNLSQHQGLFQWVDSSYQVAKVLEFQLQHQSFQRIFRTDLVYDGLVGSPYTCLLGKLGSGWTCKYFSLIYLFAKIKLKIKLAK